MERALGFSGSLLVDTSGRALGVNTSRLMRRTPMTIPSPTLRRVVETLVKHGRIRRGYLGIGGHPIRLSETIGQQAGQRRGLIIISVEPGSPADRGGQIGRASCRESVSVRVDLGGRPIIKKKI